MAHMFDKARIIKAEIGKAVIGKDDVIEKVLMAIYAGGHILIDDIPGVGKTTLAMAISRAMGLSFNRVQFTPDVLPSDIVGYNMYNHGTSSFEYIQGAAMCNLLLADEINRTSSKTQAALLEVMEEGMVTVDTVRIPVPKPFITIATENPVGSVGTSKLPESQLDRFAIQVSIGYPQIDDEVDILRNMGNSKGYERVETVASVEDLINIREEVMNVRVVDDILLYIASICKRSREMDKIALGLSPRASLCLLNMAKANAFVNGRDYVIPNDVREVFECVSGHRIILSTKIKSSENEVHKILLEIIDGVKVPNIR